MGAGRQSGEGYNPGGAAGSMQQWYGDGGALPSTTLKRELKTRFRTQKEARAETRNEARAGTQKEARAGTRNETLRCSIREVNGTPQKGFMAKAL